MTLHVWPAETPIHCNRCEALIRFDHAVESGRFCGSSAARITTLETCSTCGTTDSHWVYASDVAPSTARPGYYESPYQRNCAVLLWKRAN